MDWQRRMNDALAYMEDELEGEVEWAEAARRAACSTSHFLRMFDVIAGTSPAEYVRRRRTWAIFESRGPIPEAIQDTMRRIYGEWFPTSGFEHAGGPELEVYPLGDNKSPDYYREVWIPVVKASARS